MDIVNEDYQHEQDIDPQANVTRENSINGNGNQQELQ